MVENETVVEQTIAIRKGERVSIGLFPQTGAPQTGTFGCPPFIPANDLSAKLAGVLDWFNPLHIRSRADSDQLAWELFYVCQATWTAYERQRRLNHLLRPLLSHRTWREVNEVTGQGQQVLSTQIKEMTVLWLDTAAPIADCTELCARHPLEQVVADLAAYMAALTPVVYQHRGDVNNCTGAGFLADFASAADAFQAGCALQQTAAAFNRRQSAVGKPVFPTRVGIATGQVALATLGSAERQERTLIGNAVNLARLIQQHASPGEVWLSQATFDRLDLSAPCDIAGPIEVKGCQAPLVIYRKRTGIAEWVSEPIWPKTAPPRPEHNIQVADRVRKQLARHLHDGPIQLVSAMMMRLDFCRQVLDKDPSMLLEQLACLQGLGERAIHQMRTMLLELRPLALETQGLDAAVRALLERYQQTTDATRLTVSVETGQTDDQFPRLETGVESVLYTIVQEAVNNALKHAQARCIAVHLKKTPTAVYAVVMDNGQGFDVARVMRHYERQGSLGMIQMSEQARSIGGKLVIRSVPGQGTCIAVRLPLVDK